MECGSFRGIKLMSHTMKTWERIVDHRIRSVVVISQEQFGFMKGRSTEDAIFALRQLLEKYKEGQRKIHCTFIDLEKAYDRVPREELVWCMRKKKVSEKYIRLVLDMYKDAETVVRSTAGTSEPFPVKVGLHQGSVLSPFLFNIIMDVLTEGVRKESPWQMMFADDVVLCTEEMREAQKDLSSWCNALEKWGMKVSRSKTEYMCCNGNSEGELKIGEEAIPTVTEFKYLGSTVESAGGVDSEVNRRIQAGWNNWRKMSSILCDKKVPNRVKGKILKTVVQPAMFSIGTVPLSKRQESKLEVVDMGMSRWMLGLSRKDRVRNEEIRKRLGTTEMGKWCRQARLRRYGHVKRREDDYVGRRAMEMRMPGQRKRGRPKRRWLDCIKEDMEAVGASPEDTQDRKRWRRLVHMAATPQP